MTRQVVTLTGRVQNVGFRDLIVAIARRRHPRVAGTVRNVSANDALEIDVEGEAGAVEAFLADVLANPPAFARVDRVERARAHPTGQRGFGRLPTD